MNAINYITAADPKGASFEMLDGSSFDPTAPDPDLMAIPVIARVLSNACRFNGHCPVYYANAQHSVLVAFLAPRDRDAQRMALLHDADECFGLPDMMTMVKPLFPDYTACQSRIAEALFRAYGLSPEAHLRIKPADRRAFMLEHVKVKKGSAAHLDAWSAGLEMPAGIEIDPLSPAAAYDLFLAAYGRVFLENGVIDADFLDGRPGFVLT